MFAMQYSHRLPSDYAMQIIRERAAHRAPLWDDTEGLAFKAFVAQERGNYGAAGHLYASVYLWLEATAAAQFLMSERFQSVIDSFGRPSIETWLPLHAAAGSARQAVTLYREELVLDAGASRGALLQSEREHNRTTAASSDTVAVWSVLDPQTWRRVRFTLSAAAPDARRSGSIYQVLHLAQPGIGSLV